MGLRFSAIGRQESSQAAQQLQRKPAEEKLFKKNSRIKNAESEKRAERAISLLCFAVRILK